MTPLAEALEASVAFMQRFVVFPSDHEPRTIALWLAATSVIRQFDPFPFLMVLAPDRACGKSRTLTVARLQLEPANVLAAASVSPSAIYRGLAANPKMVLFLDEIDTYLTGPMAFSERGQELRGVIDASYEQELAVLRSHGPQHETKPFYPFGGKMLTGIGAREQYPDTIHSRAIVLSVRRRTEDEHLESFRLPAARKAAEPIRDLLRDAMTKFKVADDYYFALDGLEDRAQDNWMPLAAIADTAGGLWPAWVRDMAFAIESDKSAYSDSPGVRLLVDCRKVIDGRDRIATEELIRGLEAIDESEWKMIGLNGSSLAKRLRPYGISPRNIRFNDDSTKRGYLTAEFIESWARYTERPAAPLPSPQEEAAALLIRETFGSEVIADRIRTTQDRESADDS
jgi:hypothetical protein